MAAADMVFLADMGKIEVPDAVILIETEQQSAVADRNIPWHGYTSQLQAESALFRQSIEHSCCPAAYGFIYSPQSTQRAQRKYF
jgi:hypothetical protein